MYGDSLKDYPVAFIVVNQDKLAAHAKKHNLYLNNDAVLENSILKQEVYDSICELAVKDNLVNQERPK